MRYQNFLLLLIILLGSVSCENGKDYTSKDSNRSLENIRYDNYVRAVKNESTFQFYLVITIKDLNTMQVREICTQGNFLEGALAHELKICSDSFDSSKLQQIQIINRLRYYEFRDSLALKNLGIDKYSMEDLKVFEKSNNIDSIAIFSSFYDWVMPMKDEKTLLMIAHSLYNRGILTGENNCGGGRLIVINEKWLKNLNL